MNAIIVTFCVVTIVTISIGQAPGRSDKWMELVDECKKKTNANDEDVKSVIARQIPKSKEAACFLACMKRATGIINADNRVNMTALMDSIAPLKTSDKDAFNKLSKIFEECKALETLEPDQCEAVRKFSACVVPKKEALTKPPA